MLLLSQLPQNIYEKKFVSRKKCSVSFSILYLGTKYVSTRSPSIALISNNTIFVPKPMRGEK